MATITLEVPDELAPQFEEIADQLPEMLVTLLENEKLNIPPDAFVENRAWIEVLEFLAKAPDDQSILDFKISDALQDRLEDLLFAGNAGTQTALERAELDGYLQVIQFFNLLKAHLRVRLS